MDSQFAELKSEIEALGRFTTYVPIDAHPGQLVCASHRENNGRGLRGNSFWLSRKGTQWFLVTWMNHYYVVQQRKRLAEMCDAALRLDDKPIYSLPPEFLKQHGLVEVDDDPFGSS